MLSSEGGGEGYGRSEVGLIPSLPEGSQGDVRARWQGTERDPDEVVSWSELGFRALVAHSEYDHLQVEKFRSVSRYSLGRVRRRRAL